MSGSFNDKGQLVIGDGRIIFCTGKKRSGKSVMGRLLFASYPWDRLVIDVAGDDGPTKTTLPDIVEIHGDAGSLPRRWPEHNRKEPHIPMTLRYAPDAGSDTFLDDVDAAIGLALYHGRSQRSKGRPGVCILVHEIGVVAPSQQTRRHMRRVLQHNRHYAVTLIGCAPRPMTLDPLIIGQSDLVYVFETPQRSDRQRIAENIGVDTVDLDEAVHQLGEHEYLRYDGNAPKPGAEDDVDTRLVAFPALPDEIVRTIP